MTGASGAIYGIRFLEHACGHFGTIHLIASPHALQVVETELGRAVDRSRPTVEALLGRSEPRIALLDPKDYFSPPASGSYRHDGMVVVPCSMGTAGRIAHGVSDDLLTRAADVCLKEGRPLVLVVRETPWNLIHLRNLTRLAEAGATIMPAAPAFYTRPTTIEDLVDTVVARILQRLGVNQKVMPQWQFPE